MNVPRRRVLLVSHVFPPHVAGGAPRMGQFARLLPEHGWDVTVLTANHRDSDADRAAAAAIAERARIIEAWSPASSVVKRGQPVAKRGLRGAARRLVRGAALSLVFPDREVFWIPAAVRAGRRALAETHHDAVIATYGPASNLLVGHALASAARLPLIVDFRDLWSTLPMDQFPSRLHRAAAHRVEHAVMKHVSRLVAVSPAMAEDLAETHGVAQKDALSITNGFDPADVARVHDARNGVQRPFRLVYTGTVHIHYNLDPFWQALRTLADVRRLGLEQFVEINPFVPHDEVFTALARADALLVIETPGYYARYGYAAKVFDYVLTGKPVVGLVEAGGNTSRLLRAAGIGHCVEPDDSAGVARVVREVIALKGASPRRMDPDAAPLRDFNRTHLVAKLAGVLNDVAVQEPQGRW